MGSARFWWVLLGSGGFWWVCLLVITKILEVVIKRYKFCQDLIDPNLRTFKLVVRIMALVMKFCKILTSRLKKLNEKQSFYLSDDYLFLSTTVFFFEIIGYMDLLFVRNENKWMVQSIWTVDVRTGVFFYKVRIMERKYSRGQKISFEIWSCSKYGDSN